MTSRFPHTLRTRLIASHLLVALVGILLTSAVAGRTIYYATLEQVENNYEDLVFATSNNLEQALLNFQSGQVPAEQIRKLIEERFSQVPGASYTIYQLDGAPLLASGTNPPARADPSTDKEVWDAIRSDLGEGRSVHRNAQGIETLYLAQRINNEGKPTAILRVAIPLTEAIASARRSLILLLLTILLAVLLTSIAGYYFARSITSPINDLTQTATKLSQGDLSARVADTSGPEELQRLAETFNRMAARLQANLDELRTFVANASHELRTPLTSVKLRVEALRSGALEDPSVADRFLAELESEVDRLSRMVNDLLDLSRIEAGLAPQERAPLDLGAIAGEVTETFSARAERMGILLKLSVEPDLPTVIGNEDQLRRVFYNLVDNAIKYTNRGGHVDLILQAGEHQECVRILIQDSGYGISAKNLQHIFERFYRVEATRPRYGPPHGSGLGLPIAKSIVETHGGKIAVTSQIGVGTTFLVELPARKEN